MQCRPDSQRWRPSQQLSGGQQALLSTALALALQATCPLPLYSFDEVRPFG
jgi:chromosome segregation ATPase